MPTSTSQEPSVSSLNHHNTKTAAQLMHSLARHTAHQITVLSDENLGFAVSLLGDFLEALESAMVEEFSELPYENLVEQFAKTTRTR